MFTAVCVGLALAAHIWMSGARVPLWAVLAGLLPVFATARLAAGREQSLGGIMALMGLDQTALHFLFDAAQQHAASVASAAQAVTVSPAAIIMRLPPAPLPGMASIPAIPAIPAAAMSMPGMNSMAGMGAAAPMHMTTGMFTAHALAVAVCAWWLRRGEVAVHEVFAALAAWIADRFQLPSPVRQAIVTAGPPAARPRRTEPSRPVTTFLRFAVARRGPPNSLSFCCVN